MSLKCQSWWWEWPRAQLGLTGTWPVGRTRWRVISEPVREGRVDAEVAPVFSGVPDLPGPPSWAFSLYPPSPSLLANLE